MTDWAFRAPTGPPSQTGASATFSVAIPVYQGAHFIAGAIDSVLAQTVPPLELIVVDDGSTDDLAGAVAPYGEQVRVARVPHAGLAAARNSGMREAAGDFVVFLDADDVLEPQYLEALGALSALRPDLDILTTDCYFERGGEITGRFYEENDFPVDDQRTAILRRCFLTTKTAVRRAPYLAAGGCDPSPDLQGAEDWHLWARLIVRGARAGLVDAPLSRYRMHDSQMSAARGRALSRRVAVAEDLLTRAELTADDRATVEAALPHLRARALLATATEEPDARRARRAWLTLATSARIPARLRLRGLLGALVPGLAARDVEP